MPLIGKCVSEALEAYVAGLRDVFADGLAGVYLHGSVAWGAYEPTLSDVDVAVLHRSDLTAEQPRALEGLHQDFGRLHAAASGLDVSFVPLRLVGTHGEDALPYYREGRFQPNGGGDVNMVMWRTLNERGIAVWGTPAAHLVAPVGDEKVVENMRRNLAFLSRRMPAYVGSGAEGQVFGVLCLVRRVCRLRHRKISSKATAARWALGEVEPRWRPLLERAVTRYERGDLSGSDPLLEKESEAFAAQLRQVAG